MAKIIDPIVMYPGSKLDIGYQWAAWLGDASIADLEVTSDSVTVDDALTQIQGTVTSTWVTATPPAAPPAGWPKLPFTALVTFKVTTDEVPPRVDSRDYPILIKRRRA